MGAASLQDSGFGGFVTRINDGMTVVGIWGSSGASNSNMYHGVVFEALNPHEMIPTWIANIQCV